MMYMNDYQAEKMSQYIINNHIKNADRQRLADEVKCAKISKRDRKSVASVNGKGLTLSRS